MYSDVSKRKFEVTRQSYNKGRKNNIKMYQIFIFYSKFKFTIQEESTT